MKKICAFLMLVGFLTGCSGRNNELDRAMSVRTGLLNAAGCRFTATVSADFSDKTYSFTLQCQTDKEGNLEFIVMQPDHISGIQGQISAHTGTLVFEDAALAFPLQIDGILSPVSGPWIMIQALRGGYVRYCGREDPVLRLTVDDSYEEDALMLDIWINGENQPIQADIYENNRRILTISIRDYQLL